MPEVLLSHTGQQFCEAGHDYGFFLLHTVLQLMVDAHIISCCVLKCLSY